MKAAGFDQDRALKLYLWNMQMSATYYPLLASVEVCLRNLISKRLLDRYGNCWWENDAFHDVIGTQGKGILLRARNDVQRRKRRVTNGRMTAELSFGFWSKMLLPKYQEVLWKDIRHWFPNTPVGTTQRELNGSVTAAKVLRNRISHHEPIIKRNLSKDYADILKLLRWLSPEKEAWLRPTLTTMKMLRQRP